MNTALSVFVAGLLAIAAESSSPQSLAIYFVPFQFETYEPVTASNITAKAKYTININDQNEIPKLLALTSGKSPARFNGKRVRLLVIVNVEQGEERIMVDAEGDVFDGKSERALGKQKFDQLKALMAELTKGKD
jgi:hypothetical protein